MAEKLMSSKKKEGNKELKRSSTSPKRNTQPEKVRPNRKKSPSGQNDEPNKPNLRTIYSNSRNTLMPLGLGTDFRTKKCVVIFSDLLTGQVHTTALSIWNRMKLKEVKELNPQI